MLVTWQIFPLCILTLRLKKAFCKNTCTGAVEINWSPDQQDVATGNVRVNVNVIWKDLHSMTSIWQNFQLSSSIYLIISVFYSTNAFSATASHNSRVTCAGDQSSQSQHKRTSIYKWKAIHFPWFYFIRNYFWASTWTSIPAIQFCSETMKKNKGTLSNQYFKKKENNGSERQRKCSSGVAASLPRARHER